MAMTTYGDISPRTAAYVAKELLERGMPLLTLEKFLQAKPIPKNETKSIIFRRYNSLPLATTPLTEGVTPNSMQLTKTDITATLEQYGSLIEISDVVADTHEDPIIQEGVQILGEQAAQTLEAVRWGILTAGTNKFYSNGATRADVNTPISANLVKKIVRALKRQNAQMITSIVKSTPAFGTQAILPAYIALGHTDLENDIRALQGFIDVKDYGNTQPLEGEIGSVGYVRFILSNIFEPYPDAGGTAGSMITTSGTKADVYPIIFLGKNAAATVALKGANAITPTVINPKPSKSDPLGQRGFMGWKTYSTAVILNDAWMAVAEVAATEL